MSDNDSDYELDDIKNQMVTQTKKTTYFNGLKENKNIIDKDQAKNYIIFQNDFLHLQVNTLETKINKMSHKIKELETDNESMETSKNNLKFYVKNEHELSSYYKKINEIYDDDLVKVNKEFITLVKKIFMAFISFIMISFILLYFDYVDEFFAIANTGFLIACANLMYPFSIKLMNMFNIKKDDRIMKYKNEITKANQGNKYLDDLIDNF